MLAKDILPVILCGGYGTRLWPLSRKSFPKQFLSLNSKIKKSLLQQTQERLNIFENLFPPILMCNEEHRFIVAEQMREIDAKPNAIILEPLSKNTCPSIALAALKALKYDNDPILLVLPSDHLISFDDNFQKALSISTELAQKGRLVTFGIMPNSPHTGFGYIESKKQLNFDTLESCEINKFIEKPPLLLAKKFLLDKKYSWNSGMFMFKASAIISEIEKYYPEIINYCKKSFEFSKNDFDFTRINKDVFSKCSSISLDFAIMEKTKIGSVVPLNLMWNDIGDWNSLWEFEEKDNNGNFVEGKVVLKDVSNSLLKSTEDRLLVGMGLNDLIVFDTHDAILISNKSHSQEIKDLVIKLKKEDFEEVDHHKQVFRPWGYYFTLASDKYWQLKIINVNPGASLSLQKHKFRSEHWVVVKGEALVRIEDEETLIEENQSTFIPLGFKHKLSNPGKEVLSIIEVQSGTYLGEDDIIRYEDLYGRSS